jgi:hypothetical protein
LHNKNPKKKIYDDETQRLKIGNTTDQEEYRKRTGKAATWQGRVIDKLLLGECSSGIVMFFKGFFIATAMWLVKADGLPNVVKIGYVAFSLLFLFHDVMILAYKTHRDHHKE